MRLQVNRRRSRGRLNPSSASERWKHDMYTQEDGEVDQSVEYMDVVETQTPKGKKRPDIERYVPRGKTDKTQSLAEVSVTNLHWNVTASDISELASVVEGFKYVRMDYDKSGRFTGSCIVYFDRLDSALIATAKYNGRDLDSLPMQWTLVPKLRTPQKKSVTIFDRLGKRPEDRLGPKMGEPKRKPIQSSKRNKSSKMRKPLGTMDSLNAEIDEYMSGMDNNVSTFRNNS